MFNEEVWVAGLTAIVVWATARVGMLGTSASDRATAVRWLVLAGVASGLASLTKLTGVLAPAVAVATLLLQALSADAALARARVRQALLVGAIAAALGGWFYVRQWALTGTPWPPGFSGHTLMLSMPPGERSLLDYVRVPLATFRAPLATHPDLLRSVWGTTYAGIWFDAHRHFVPREGAAIAPVSTFLLTLALVPTAAFAVGVGSALRSLAGDDAGSASTRGVRALELPLLVLTGATLSGFVLYTIANPWFATTKGPYLLGLCVPFAFYASRTLERWIAHPAAGWPLLVGLAALALGCAMAFHFETPLWDWGTRPSGPGLPWRGALGRAARRATSLVHGARRRPRRRRSRPEAERLRGARCAGSRTRPGVARARSHPRRGARGGSTRARPSMHRAEPRAGPSANHSVR